jgi:hypothetical protein
MEASAFLHICRHVGATSLGVIKGVSDMGDSAKGQEQADINCAALYSVAQAIETWVIARLKEGDRPDTTRLSMDTWHQLHEDSDTGS